MANRSKPQRDPVTPAFILGVKAYDKGVLCAPCLDAKFLEILPKSPMVGPANLPSFEGQVEMLGNR